MEPAPTVPQLSIEHERALALARRWDEALTLSGISPEIVAELLGVFQAEFMPHFEHEETTILPVLERAGRTDLVERTLADHRILRNYCSAIESGGWSHIGTLTSFLIAHVRFEENELYPTYNAALTSVPVAP